MREGWEAVKLKKITKIINGFAFKSKDFSGLSEIPIVKIKSLKNQIIIVDESAKVSSSFLLLDKKYHINKNDILIALTGSHTTQPASAVGRVAKSRLDETLLLNQRVGKFQVNKNICDHNFLFYFLTTDFFFENVGLRARGGSNQANISGGDVLSTQINLPPIKTQRKIATILSAYDDLIENNLKRIKLLEEQTQQTYEEWFVRFKFPGYENAEFDEESELPIGWEFSKLGNLVSLQAKMLYPKDLPRETPYIGLEHIPRKSITLSNWETAEKVNSSKYGFKKGDILFGKIRPYFHKVGVALVDGIASSDTIILRPKKSNLHGLILQTVYSNHFVDSATQSSNGTKMPRANWKVLKKYPVIIPTNVLIQKYDKINRNIIDLISSCVYQNQLLKEARDILLPRLMTGMIDPSASSGQVVNGLEVGEGLGIVAEENSEYKTNQK